MAKVYKPIRVAQGGFLPEKFDVAHDLCFVIHDAIAAILSDGETGGFFQHQIPLPDAETGDDFKRADNPVVWLQAKGFTDDAAKVLRCVTFPAVLSDMLHCIYEALECSRKAKLNVTFMLLRKPLQESLYVLEEIVLGLEDFAHKLSTEPLTLRAERAGGIDAHTRRITDVLHCLNADVVFAPRRLAELRYDKVLGFDGLCNRAMHLFTEHHAIRTELMNINFVFSGPEEKQTQWEYLYLNLPYVLDYVRHLVEHISNGMSKLDPRYQEALNRKVAALFCLWAGWADPSSYDEAMAAHAHRYWEWLEEHCTELGLDGIEPADLITLAGGGIPSEAPVMRRLRALRDQLPWWRRRR